MSLTDLFVVSSVPRKPPGRPFSFKQTEEMIRRLHRLRRFLSEAITAMEQKHCYRQNKLPSINIAETVCGGSSDVASVLKSWLSSRAHARILMDPQYEDAGIGIARGVTRTYWVLMLGARPRNSSPGRSWGRR
jgi:Cysteine-rich secretory protein family